LKENLADAIAQNDEMAEEIESASKLSAGRRRSRFRKVLRPDAQADQLGLTARETHYWGPWRRYLAG
jgi:hypothetical protein